MRTNHHKKSDGGFVLLIAVITSAIVLAMGFSILNITLKEFQLANVSRDSEFAFYAADAGIECATYWDESNAGGVFNIGVAPPAAVTCMGVSQGLDPSSTYGSTIASGETGVLYFDWGGGATPPLCAKVTVQKLSGPPSTCPAGATCTTVKSSGYNRSCAVVQAGNDPRTVERRLKSSY